MAMRWGLSFVRSGERRVARIIADCLLQRFAPFSPAMPLPPAPDRRPLTQADKDLLFKGVTCALIGGVILLAPFLSRLWTQLGWATERGFADTDTAWLAVQLIQYLCDGQAETPPEYCLALPKILCGFRPDAVFEPPRALNDAERTEGDALLQAVLEHVPGLGLKTTGALRGSFLMRRGVLRPGDFQWLLTVEKETYDIVLQKVPWGFQVLKFPWMAVAVFVEWEV